MGAFLTLVCVILGIFAFAFAFTNWLFRYLNKKEGKCMHEAKREKIEEIRKEKLKKRKRKRILRW